MIEFIEKNATTFFRVFLANTLILASTLTLAQQDDDDLLIYLPPILAAAAKDRVTQPSSNLCQGFLVNDTLNRPMMPEPKPAVGATYNDAVFGSRITRITNSDAISSGVIKTMYNTVQAWNADESRLILWHRGDGHHLYNGKNYQHLQKLLIGPVDLEQVFWSSTDPDTFVYPNSATGQVVQTSAGSITLQGNELVQYNIKTQRYKVLKDFNSQCPTSDVTAGNDVQMNSASNDVFGFRCGQQGVFSNP